MESIVSGFVCGILYGFFSGQPLTILASTGPVLVFETIVYKFCVINDLDYMSLRYLFRSFSLNEEKCNKILSYIDFG